MEMWSALEPSGQKRQKKWMPETEKEGVVDECAFEETINSRCATRTDLFSFLLTEATSQ